MNIGPLLTAPTRDPAWKRKLMMMGLLGLVPALGLLNLYGYLAQVYRQALRGETKLPAVSLGYIVDGIKLYVPILPILCLVPSVYLFQWGMDFVLDADFLPHALVHPVAVHHWGIFVGYKVIVALLLLLALFLGPAIAHQHLSKGQLLASLRIPGLLWTVVKKPGAYLLLWLMVAVSGLIAGLGIMVMGIGLVLSVPYAMVVLGASLAAFDRELGGD